MSNKEPEYVYILTNPSFRDDWVKIGIEPSTFRTSENETYTLQSDIFS